MIKRGRYSRPYLKKFWNRPADGLESRLENTRQVCRIKVFGNCPGHELVKVLAIQHTGFPSADDGRLGD